MKNNIKIFVSYHKNMPYFESDIFSPIFCGAEMLKKPLKKFSLTDNTGKNISNKNIYYSELTGHYWVLKNYLDNANEDYIGFCHYRRFWDILNISDVDYPSAFGVNYHSFKKLFNKWKKYDITCKLSDYDVILPCKSYFTGSIINPIKPTDDSGHTFKEYFKLFHVENLHKELINVLNEDYTDYVNAADAVFNRDYMYPYNMYIMKTPLLKEFLTWMFDIFEKIENKIENFKIPKYYRQFGFLSEIMVNIWLEKEAKAQNLRIGYCPFYMLDFETSYLEKAALLKESGEFEKSIKEILKIIKYTDNKTKYFNLIAQLYSSKNDFKNTIKYAKCALKNSNDILSFLLITDAYQQLKDFHHAFYYAEKTLDLMPDDKTILNRLLFLSEQIKDRKKYEYYFYKLNKR